MTNTIIWTIAIITVLGLLLALVLYLVAKKFKVEEDPRIDEVEKVMPGANCGGCGFAGCRAFAEAAVKASSLDGIFCPVGGNAVMTQVAGILGYEAKVMAPQVAVVRCNGTCEARPRLTEYDGFATCGTLVLASKPRMAATCAMTSFPPTGQKMSSRFGALTAASANARQPAKPQPPQFAPGITFSTSSMRGSSSTLNFFATR